MTRLWGDRHCKTPGGRGSHAARPPDRVRCSRSSCFLPIYHQEEEKKMPAVVNVRALLMCHPVPLEPRYTLLRKWWSLALSGGLRWLGHHPVHQEGWGFRPRSGRVREATSLRFSLTSMLLSLFSLSRFLEKSIIKHILQWGLKKKDGAIALNVKFLLQISYFHETILNQSVIFRFYLFKVLRVPTFSFY